LNHRDLVLSARKKARFAFLELPEDLQDEIIDGFDGKTLTLQGAADLVKARLADQKAGGIGFHPPSGKGAPSQNIGGAGFHPLSGKGGGGDLGNPPITSLSHEAIAGYYRAVRTERRLLEMNQELKRVIAEFAKKPQAQALESLVNLVIATAASGLADGSVGIKDVDLAKLIEAMSNPAKRGTSAGALGAPSQPGSEPPQVDAKKSPGLSPEAVERIRRDILGVAG
jgi:hypothetical protein